MPLLRAGSNTAGFYSWHTGQYPVGFGVFSGLEIPQVLWATNSSVQSPSEYKKISFSLCSHEICHASSPFSGHDWEFLASFNTVRYLYTLVSFPQLFHFQAEHLISISLSWYDRFSAPLIIFTALHWVCSMSLLYQGIQCKIQHSREDPSSMKQRGTIMSCDLLAICSLILEAVGHFCYKCTVLPHVHQQLQIVFCQVTFPLALWCLRLFLKSCRTWHFPLDLKTFPVASSSSLLRSLWMSVKLSGVATSPPNFLHLKMCCVCSLPYCQVLSSPGPVPGVYPGVCW